MGEDLTIKQLAKVVYLCLLYGSPIPRPRPEP